MSSNGADSDLAIQTRAALLDALTALTDHRESVIVIGAQAIYLHAGEAPVAVAAYTKDSDLALDSRTLGQDPRIEDAMRTAGFTGGDQPGSWVDPHGIPVDLMVPTRSLSRRSTRRSDPTAQQASDPTSRRSRGRRH